MVQQSRLLQQTDILLTDHLLLTVFRDQEAAGHALRAAVLNQPDVVLTNDLVGEFTLVSNAVNFLYRECLIGP